VRTQTSRQFLHRATIAVVRYLSGGAAWVYVTFVYCVETAKDTAKLQWNANRKSYPRFRCS